MFRYNVCGLVWETNLPIPGLSLALVVDASPVVQVRLQEMPGWVAQLAADGGWFYESSSVGPTGEPTIRAGALDSGHYFRLLRADGLVGVVDRTGDRLWLTWSEGTTADPFEFLLESLLGFLLRRRGTMCLHAAAVAIGRRALLLAGWPGAGKSTLAIALGKRAHAIVTDDVVALTVRHGQFAVHPGPEQIMVRRDAMALINRMGGQVSWTAAGDRFAAIDRLQPGFSQPRDVMPIGGICFVEKSAQVTAPRLLAVRPSEALMRLVGDTWATRLQDRTMRAREFEGLSDFVRGTPSWVLEFSPAAGELEAMCDLIEGCTEGWVATGSSA